ncbi:MAG TPA: DUF4956 domain-containing protein [Pirellulales bacterium]|jgi:uncharacterized membrane protein YhiD involved in acid resistance
MPEWLATTTGAGIPDDVTGLAMRLAMSFAFGGAVALIYLASHGRERSHPAPLATTLVLLSMLIAMVSIVIGNSVARAFSLVGALSIVRFRTVVDDTRDTAFVIFAVIVGMAAGAGLFLVALVGVPITGLVAIAMSHWTAVSAAARPSRHHLSVRLALGRDRLAVERVMSEYLQSFVLTESSTARQGEAIDCCYETKLQAESDMALLVIALNRVEGVMNVEMRRI